MPANHHESMIKVLQDFRVVLRSIKQHYEWVERRTGMGGAQLWALSEIADSPGIKASELAERLAIHRSTASNMLKRLVMMKLVTRDRTGEDQREVRLRLTALGTRALQKAPGPRSGVLQQALLDLPPARLAALRKELQALLRVMKGKSEKARTMFLADI